MRCLNALTIGNEIAVGAARSYGSKTGAKDMTRIAIVTGGTRGIGAAISTALKDAGIKVAATYVGNDERAHTFTEETAITFHADGSYSWKTVDASDEAERRQIPQDAFYIVGSKKKKLHLKGVVKGKVLVYSPGKIIIDDDLTYARHPEISFVADDYLGLVSDRDIEIAHPNVTGPGDLHIHAAIYAKKRFRVRHLRAKGSGTLYIYGSLTAGSLTATEPRYATHIQFDKRLENSRPPNFPMTDRYEIKEWDGKWEVK